MAKATLKEETTVKVVGVTLELTYKEAQYLRALLFCHVGGFGDMRNTLTTNIGGALEYAGVEPAPERAYQFEGVKAVYLNGGDL